MTTKNFNAKKMLMSTVAAVVFMRMRIQEQLLHTRIILFHFLQFLRPLIQRQLCVDVLRRIMGTDPCDSSGAEIMGSVPVICPHLFQSLLQSLRHILPVLELNHRANGRTDIFPLCRKVFHPRQLHHHLFNLLGILANQIPEMTCQLN